MSYLQTELLIVSSVLSFFFEENWLYLLRANSANTKFTAFEAKSHQDRTL